VKISRCYEILDLPAGATEKELKEAYRDAMSVWHPDRFSANPRLRRKAEEKAAQINGAYEILSVHISRRETRNSREGGGHDEGRGAGSVERAAEVGTRAVLHFGHAVYCVLRKLTSSK
jgi:curved DNA-binding protein CbpA